MQEVFEVIKVWILHKFTVHCTECDVCKSCEILMEQLEFERQRCDYLIHHLSELKAGVPEEIEQEVENFQPIQRNIPWKVRQQMLETEDRRKYDKKKQSVEELEKELGVTNHAS